MTKNTFRLLAAVLVSAAAAGCVVVPARVAPVYEAPPGVVYVAPLYASPGPGWRHYHPQYGWGWHHREYGWHRGWR